MRNSSSCKTPSPDSSASSHHADLKILSTKFSKKSPTSSVVVMASLSLSHRRSFLAALDRKRQGQDHPRPPWSIGPMSQPYPTSYTEDLKLCQVMPPILAKSTRRLRKSMSIFFDSLYFRLQMSQRQQILHQCCETF